MKRTLLKVGSAIAILTVVIGCGLGHLTRAEESTPTAMLEVTPVSRHLKLDSGMSFDSEFTVVNDSNEAINFRVYAEGYTMSDDTGEPIYGQDTAYTQLARWINFDQTEYTNVAPGAQIPVRYHIEVPKDSPGGGQYAVLFAATTTDGVGSDGANVQTINRAGMLIYADLGGETRKGGEVVELNQPGLYISGPIGSTVKVKNTGNIDFVITHDYSVKSIFGKEVYNNSSDSNASRIILPGVTRNIESKWRKTPAVGIYKVRNTIKFLGNTQYNEEKLVVVAPIWLICLFIVVIVGIIALVVYRVATKKRKVKFRGVA
jgi:hypothetical protein